MPLKPQADKREEFPLFPANRTHRLMCIAVVDKGMVHNEKYDQTNHKIMMVHESRVLHDDESSKYHDMPYLLFTTCNFYYGKMSKDGKNKKKTKIVSIIEAHERRSLEDEERVGDNLYDIEQLVGKTVKGYIELVGTNNFAVCNSWQYDLTEDGTVLEPWEKVSEWVPKGEREKNSDFNYGKNKKDEDEEDKLFD